VHDDWILLQPGCPIRKSPDQRLLAAPRSLSQLTTSFIVSWRQGIHRMLLLSWPLWCFLAFITIATALLPLWQVFIFTVQFSKNRRTTGMDALTSALRQDEKCTDALISTLQQDAAPLVDNPFANMMILLV
jgi:hypothetical protein